EFHVAIVKRKADVSGHPFVLAARMRVDAGGLGRRVQEGCVHFEGQLFSRDARGGKANAQQVLVGQPERFEEWPVLQGSLADARQEFAPYRHHAAGYREEWRGQQVAQMTWMIKEKTPLVPGKGVVKLSPVIALHECAEGVPRGNGDGLVVERPGEVSNVREHDGIRINADDALIGRGIDVEQGVTAAEARIVHRNAASYPAGLDVIPPQPFQLLRSQTLVDDGDRRGRVAANAVDQRAYAGKVVVIGNGDEAEGLHAGASRREARRLGSRQPEVTHAPADF